MQADRSLLDHMTDLMAQYATRAEKTAKKVRVLKVGPGILPEPPMKQQ
jgi:hypothetical protein